MSTPEVTVIQDIRPLIAFVAPLLGVIGIVWAGEKRKNLRETFTFLVASIQATVVLSMVPILLSISMYNVPSHACTSNAFVSGGGGLEL